MTGRWGMGIMRQNLIITRSKSNGLQVSVLKQSKYCQDYIVPFSSLFVLVLKGTFITNKKNPRTGGVLLSIVTDPRSLRQKPSKGHDSARRTTAEQQGFFCRTSAEHQGVGTNWSHFD
jgi:hypothetical protein